MAEKWNGLPDGKSLQKTVEAARQRGFEVIVAENGKEALEKIKSIIPKGAEVMSGTSTTLSQIGYDDYLKSGKHGWKDMHQEIGGESDGQKRADLRRKAAASEYFLGSVNAISQNGELVAVDASGSRVTSYPFAAKNVVLVAGANKITKSLEHAMKRVREYVYPLEDERAKKVYGAGSSTAKWVIIEREFAPGRIKLILVKEKLGF